MGCTSSASNTALDSLPKSTGAPVKVLITSGGGFIGQATLQVLAASAPQVHVTVTSRGGPSGPSADKIRLSHQHAHVVADDAPAEALDGQEVVVIIPPGSEDRAEVASRWIDAIAAGGAASSVKHVVLISVPLTERAEILFQRQFGRAEERLKHLSSSSNGHVTYTILQLDFFLVNLLGWAPTLQATKTLYMHLGESGWFAGTSTQDAGTAIAAIVATTPAPTRAERFGGKTYQLVGNERNTGESLAHALGEVCGGEYKYVNVTDGEQVVQGMLGMGMPEWQARGILEMFVMYAAGKGTPAGNGHFKEITGREPQSVKDVIRENASAFG